MPYANLKELIAVVSKTTASPPGEQLGKSVGYSVRGDSKVRDRKRGEQGERGRESKSNPLIGLNTLSTREFWRRILGGVRDYLGVVLGGF